MLVGYLENLNRNRRLISMAQMRLDILYFIGYDLDETLPWHSTISRTRQLYGPEVFSRLFKEVLKQCIEKGMGAGKRQAVDGVFVKANASLDPMVEREILEDTDTYISEPEANAEQAAQVVKFNKNKSDENKEGSLRKNATNETHYSPSDPEAKMSVKSGKKLALNYLGMKKVNTKGIAQANKCMTMAATAYNLKKLLMYAGGPKVVAKAQALITKFEHYYSNLFKNISTQRIFALCIIIM